MMPLFPFFVDISNKNGLLVGGGRKALQKALKLQDYTERLWILTDNPLPDLERLAVEKRWRMDPRGFRPADLEQMECLDYVIASTEDREENRRIAVECRSRGIPVNAVDDPAYCDFVFPSLVTRGKLSVGITTEGASPVFSSIVREHLEEWLPECTEEILEWLEEKKVWMRQRCPEMKVRSSWMRQVLAEAFRRNRPLTEEELLEILIIGGK